MDPRIPHTFGSALLLAGAFAIGWAIHGSVVTGQFGVLSPAAVLITLAGLGFLAVGRFLEGRFDPSEWTVDVEDEEDEEEFDEELSPLDEESMSGYDRDDSFES